MQINDRSGLKARLNDAPRGLSGIVRNERPSRAM